MIKILNSNAIAFEGGKFSDISSDSKNSNALLSPSSANIKDKYTRSDVNDKKQIKEKFTDLKDSYIGAVKGASKFTKAAKGTVKGIAGGTAAAAAAAFVGRNIQKGDGKIGDTLAAMAENAGNMASAIVKKGIPFVWKNSPKTILTKIACVPKAFYKYCSSGVKEGAKGTKVVGTIATLAGVGTFAYNIVKGVLQGNKAAADIDHYTGRGHTK